jgi:hypothetical protein
MTGKFSFRILRSRHFDSSAQPNPIHFLARALDIYDAIILAGAFNAGLGDHNWNPNADFNGDNIVDIYDAILLANNYGITA